MPIGDGTMLTVNVHTLINVFDRLCSLLAFAVKHMLPCLLQPVAYSPLYMSQTIDISFKWQLVGLTRARMLQMRVIWAARWVLGFCPFLGAVQCSIQELSQ
jgi:hypothetical protein